MRKGKGMDFEAFYERHYKLVYRLCLIYLKHPQDAEDCAADVFMKALAGKKAFESEEHERRWLCVVGVNCCKDRLKHWWRKNAELKEDLPAREEGSEVLRAVMELPEKYKEAVLLHYYMGYTSEETARLTGRTASMVRNHLKEAREILRRELGGED